MKSWKEEKALKNWKSQKVMIHSIVLHFYRGSIYIWPTRFGIKSNGFWELFNVFATALNIWPCHLQNFQYLSNFILYFNTRCTWKSKVYLQLTSSTVQPMIKRTNQVFPSVYHREASKTHPLASVVMLSRENVRNINKKLTIKDIIMQVGFREGYYIKLGKYVIS